jgi:hypothetical protein
MMTPATNGSLSSTTHIFLSSKSWFEEDNTAAQGTGESGETATGDGG